MLATTDQTLLRKQYADASNLDARKSLHKRFSTNQYNWFHWLFDHYDLPANARVLELGTGPADLWVNTLDRIPAGWQITLSDFSPGMLDAARANLGDAAERFDFREIDAQAIPLADDTLDAVIANHMLYHVPDRQQAFAEITRVLKPGGRLFAVTNSENNMRELAELIQRFLRTTQSEAHWSSVGSRPFTLENSREQLAPWFSQVTLHEREDALLIPEAEPIVAYVRSGARLAIAEEIEAGFLRFVADEIATNGPIHISKGSGLFEAHV